ncbi:ATP synthase subunit g, mitochondrial [[Candida] anglica]|uniref:ATP synthase subunit g, mitochondrial n=1 Tax=[Candida] anglica TaxID=148631 RepID=A0ABP0EHR9_9ASCO
MSAIIAKATGFVNSTVAKSTQLANCAVYWGKVGAEVGKVIYKKEGLAPPTTKEFETVFQNAVKFLKSGEQQKQFLEKAAAFKPTKECAVKAGIYGTQLLAFFSVGEIIGRRHVFGYPSVGSNHH